MDYVAVTGYYETINRKHVFILFDILELIELVYSGVYLALKLLEVINRLGITYIIIFVTRNNAFLNDIILEEYEVIV